MVTYGSQELAVACNGTSGFQVGNHGLPLQATAGCQRLELMVPNVGTKGWSVSKTQDRRPAERQRARTKKTLEYRTICFA